MPDHYWNAEPQLAHQYFIRKRKLPNINCTLCDVQVCEHNDFAVSNICGKKIFGFDPEDSGHVEEVVYYDMFCFFKIKY